MQNLQHSLAARAVAVASSASGSDGNSAKAGTARDIGASVRELILHGGAGPLAAKLYRAAPTASRLHTLLVFFHGGGFVTDGLDRADGFLLALARANPDLLILAPRYTLAASGPFPAAVEDAHAVLAWASRHKADLGWSGKRLLVAGVEAGANLATVANLVSHDRHGPAIAAQILIAPMLDPSLSSGSMRACEAGHCDAEYRHYLPHAADRMHPYAAPLQSSRLRHMAPALILSADGDPLRDEAEQYAARLLASGVPVTLKRLGHSTGAGRAATDSAAVLRAVNQYLCGLEKISVAA